MTGMIAWVTNSTQPDLCYIALQMSNLIPSANEAIRTIDTEEARLWHERLCSGTQAAFDIFQKAEFDHIIMWAPPNHDTLLRALASIRKWQRNLKATFKITLLHPTQLPPSTDTFEAVADLCGHPLLQDKWTPDMQNRFILWEPGSYTFTGKLGPISTSRPIIGATFATNENLGFVQEVIHWKRNATHTETGKALIIDTATKILPMVEKAIAKATLPFQITWETPDTSLSSSKNQHRTTLRGYLPRGLHNDLTATLCTRHIRTILPKTDTYVGRLDTYYDGTALLAEFTHWAAMDHCQHLCDDITPINHKQALIKTQAPQRYGTTSLPTCYTTTPRDAYSKYDGEIPRTGAGPGPPQQPPPHNYKRSEHRHKPSYKEDNWASEGTWRAKSLFKAQQAQNRPTRSPLSWHMWPKS